MKKFYFALMALLGVNTCAFADNWMSHLPDETYVVHGHGVDSTIEILKRTNPYFK